MLPLLDLRSRTIPLDSFLRSPESDMSKTFMPWSRALTRQPDDHIDVALVKEFYANLFDLEDKSP